MQSSVKCHLHFGIVVWLICGAFLIAQSYSSTEQKQQPPSSNANPKEPRQSAGATAHVAGVDILSDTKGVDIGPYLKSVLKIVKRNWYNLIPQSARAPKMKRGNVSIELAIFREGKIKGMRLAEGSGDVSLDAGAWHGIGDSRLPPLPAEYSGQYLALRFHFSYNPDKPSDIILQYRE